MAYSCLQFIIKNALLALVGVRPWEVKPLQFSVGNEPSGSLVNFLRG